jgi:hypothetical protein
MMIDMTTVQSAPAFMAVVDLSNAHFAARALHVAAELGIADALGVDEVLDASVIAERSRCQPSAVERVLRALYAHGVFVRDGDMWRHNEASAHLRRDHPQSTRDYARMIGSPFMWGCVSEMAHSVVTGEPAATLLDPDGVWAYLARHPDEATTFNAAMTAKSHADAFEMVSCFDMANPGTIVDVGGGRGHLLDALLDAHPTANGVLFDLPAVAAEAIQRPDGRLQLHPGDFFTDPIPNYDTALLMTVIHDWADAEAQAILRATRAAAASPLSRLLIVDQLVADDGHQAFTAALDLAMLTIGGGQERSIDQLRSLLDTAGFELTTVTPLPSGKSVVEAKPTVHHDT